MLIYSVTDLALTRKHGNKKEKRKTSKFNFLQVSWKPKDCLINVTNRKFQLYATTEEKTK